MSHLDYTSRLKALNLPSLEHRRRVADMVQVYKIIYDLERIEKEHFFTYSQTMARGHSKKLFKPRARLNLRKNSFSHRVIKDWNSLPEYVISAADLDTFKASLSEFWEAEKFSNSFEP